MPQDTQSARGRRSLPGSGTVRASSLTREPLNQTNRWVLISTKVQKVHCSYFIYKGKPPDVFCILYRESNSHNSCRSQTHSIADKTEYIKQISGLLGSKDFRERIKGIDQLAADCQHNPNMVINSIFPVSTSFLFFQILSIFLCYVLCHGSQLPHHTSLFHHENITKMSLFYLFVLLPPVSPLSVVWCLQGQAAGVQQ